MNNYDINSIETLEFRDAVRKRIAMYLGSADMQGVYNAIQEIISNSIDEFYMGYGNKIEIFIEDNFIKIRDYGRGIPFGIKEDGSNVLVDIFSKPHTGGKFNEKVYQSVAGLNGIGGKAVCLSSDFFTVITKNTSGNVAKAYFEKGILKEYREEEKGSLDCSTEVSFLLDSEVYNLEPIKINIEVLKNKCKNLAYLTKGLSFYLNEVTKKGMVSHKYSAENGLKDLLSDNVKTPVNEIPIYFETEENGNKIEIALQWTKEKEKSWVFTNGLENSEGGTSLTGMKTAITRYIKKKIENNFDGDMARVGLHYAVSCKVSNPSFANQTKTKINNPELNGLAQKTTRLALEKFEKENPNEMKKILDFLAKEQKAEIAANKAREAVLNATRELNESKKKKVFNVDKLSDCEELGENAVLLLVEGDSAGGAMARARDTKKFGILRLRGKIINALSNSLEDVLENEEVKLFLLATGIDINNYKNSKLRYGKVAICVDADSDGNHIACLIMALLLKLAPDFLKENRLHWLRAPLFKIEKGNKTFFYYSDEEFEKREVLGGLQYRFKGLGEMSTEDTRQSMFDKNLQRLDQLNWTDDGEQILEDLMGENVQPRKDFVFNKIDFEKYGEL